jgi:hypothetical protein
LRKRESIVVEFMPRACLFAACLLMACRDEQAGPKRVPLPPRQNGSQLQTLETAPALQFQSGGTWASGAVKYLGSTLSVAKAGQSVTAQHFFQSTAGAPKGFRFFTHLVDANTGEQVANVDHEFAQGAAPLGSWPADKIVVDTHTFSVPAGAAKLQLLVGFWNDQGRLPIDTVMLSDGNGRMRGPTFEIGQETPMKQYVVKKTSSPPVIDGKLEDAVWKQASTALLVNSFDGQPARVKTTVRLAYDDAFLYAAFDCEDRDVWGTFRQKDDAIYTEDAVELFIDADGDGKTYNELQVSPHNVNFDASFVARRSDLDTAKKWESGMQSAVKVNGTLDDDKVDQGFSVEMRIPIQNLNAVPNVPPKAGDVWRFNAYRLEHHQRRTDIEGQAFSELHVGDFHALPRFGALRFE